MHKITLLLLVGMFFTITANAQRLIGTTGLMNIPTAEMKPAGTFDGGINFMQEGATNRVYNFDTGIYYINFTPFSFLEFTFRETLLKTIHSVKNTMGYYQQDRSTTFRLRPIAEQNGKWWPSVVLGVNDIYSAYGDSYYTGFYGTITKHFHFGHADCISVTAGYFKPFHSGKMYDGFFGGIEYRPFRNQPLSVSAEYDSHSINIGAAYRLWKCVNIFCYTDNFKAIAAGISYQHTINF